MRKKLTEFRGERSQEEMAGLYGVSQQLWSKWERGVCCPSPAMMKQLEMDTGIPMETLFFDAFNHQIELRGESADSSPSTE